MRYEQTIRSKFDVRGTSGVEFICICPWHDDNGKPNLYINGTKGVFHCHACHKSGHLRNIGGAIEAPRAIDIKERLATLRKVEDPSRIYTESWLERFHHHHDYWASRGYSDETVERFQLGYDPVHDRVTIPVRNLHGQLLGVIQRVLDDSKPKYRYPRGFAIRQHLFGSWLVEGHGKVALTEGSLDAISCWEARVPALGLMGSYMTDEKRDLLVQTGVRTVVIFTDNDKPGRDAILQVRESLKQTGVQVKVAVYRDYWAAKDPGELTSARIRKAYHSALPWHRWVE